MNKVVVGYAPSPNLMKVQSRIGSLSNNDHKVGQLFIWEIKTVLMIMLKNGDGDDGDGGHNDQIDIKDKTVRFAVKEMY